MLHLVSLGSSFAAGPGIPPISNEEAGRSGNNYASLLAAKLGVRHTDLTVSGATLLNLSSEPQGSFPPQISQLPADADIVTITAGGNDINFIGGIFEDTVRNTRWWGAAMIFLYRLWSPANPISEDALVDRLRQTFSAIRAKAPNARIVLVEYVTVLGEDARPGAENPLTVEQIGKHKGVQEMLVRAMRTSGEDVEIARISESSWKHGVGADEPWVNGWDSGMESKGIAPWHPNLAGMKGVADVLYEQLKR